MAASAAPGSFRAAMACASRLCASADSTPDTPLPCACALAASLSIMRFTSNWAWGFPMSYDAALVNNVLRAVTLMLVAFLTELDR